MTKVSPAVPSILQREVDRAVSEGAAISLILCGSAMSVMGGLLAGSAPLRGRANLELVVRPFDHRVAAGYWKVANPRLAVQLHAVVGGTPAYRRFVNDDGPEDLADFDDWVLRTVLDPSTPLVARHGTSWKKRRTCGTPPSTTPSSLRWPAETGRGVASRTTAAVAPPTSATTSPCWTIAACSGANRTSSAPAGPGTGSASR